MSKLFKKVLKIKYLVLFVALIICFLPRIYSSESEVGLRAVVTSLGIDRVDEGYELTAQAFVPIAEDSKSEQKTIISATDASVAAAASKFTVMLGRVTTLAHCKLIVLGKSVMADGCLPALDFVMRGGRISWNAVVMASNEDAKSTMEQINELEKSTSFSWKNYMSNTKKYTKIAINDLKSFMNESYGDARASFLSVISVKKLGEQTDGESQMPQSAIDEKAKIMLVKEGKSQGILENGEANGISWLDKESLNGIISVEDVGGDYYDGGIVSVNMDEKRVHRWYTFKDGKPLLKVEIDAKFEEIEVMRDYPAKINDEKRAQSRKLLEQKLGQKAEQDILSAIKKCADTNTDALNLSAHFNRFAHRQYKSYINDRSLNDFLNDLTVEVKTIARIK